MLKTVQLCPTCSCSRSVCYCRPRQVPGGKASLTNVMSISSFSSSCGTTSSEKAGEVTLEAETQKLGSEFKTFIQSFISFCLLAIFILIHVQSLRCLFYIPVPTMRLGYIMPAEDPIHMLLCKKSTFHIPVLSARRLSRWLQPGKAT